MCLKPAKSLDTDFYLSKYFMDRIIYNNMVRITQDRWLSFIFKAVHK